MRVKHHASFSLFLWILDGITAQPLTAQTPIAGDTQSSNQNGLSRFQPKVFRHLNAFRAGSHNLSEMDKQVILALKNLRDRKKKKGDTLTNKEKKLVKELLILQKRKGTHFRRANYEAENHEDLTEIIKDMSKGIGGWDSFEVGGHSSGTASLEKRLDKLEEQQEEVMKKLDKLLDDKDDDYNDYESGSDESDERRCRGRKCKRPYYHPTYFPPHLYPGYPYPRYPYPPYRYPPGINWTPPPNYHIPGKNLYSSGCPCKNNGKCSPCDGRRCKVGWAICVCFGPYTGDFCERHKVRMSRRVGGNELMSKTETDKQKPFKIETQN